jgi:hypothetical protein
LCKTLTQSIFFKKLNSKIAKTEELDQLKVTKQELQHAAIRLIDFEDFCGLSSYPRYSENKNLLVDFGSIDRDNSLVIFISHRWLRGWSGADGWDGR